MDRVHDRVHVFTCFFLRKAMIILFLQGPRLIFNRLNIWAQHELNHSMSDKSITFFLLHKTIPLKSYHIIYINQSIYLSSIYLLILSSFYPIQPFFDLLISLLLSPFLWHTSFFLIVFIFVVLLCILHTVIIAIEIGGSKCQSHH